MPFPTTGLLPSGGLLDDFNRGDQPLSNSSNWADNWFNLPFGGLNVISNECGNISGTFATSDWVAAEFTDTEVYIDLPDGRLGDIALIARTINRRTATASGYVLVFALTGDAVRIERWTNSSPTVLVTTTQAISAGDSIGFEVIGDTLTAWHKPAAGSWTSILSTTDSTYSGAGGIGIVMSENSTRAENFSGGEVIAPLVVTPDPITVDGSTVNPTVVLGSVSITPAALTTVASVVAPTVVLGSLTLTPTALEAVSSTVNPTVILGSLTLTPDALNSTASTVNPTIILGSISITPPALLAVTTVNGPTIPGNDVVVTPAAISAVVSTVNPTVILGSITLVPAAVLAITSTVNPFFGAAYGEALVTETLYNHAAALDSAAGQAINRETRLYQAVSVDSLQVE